MGLTSSSRGRIIKLPACGSERIDFCDDAEHHDATANTRSHSPSRDWIGGENVVMGGAVCGFQAINYCAGALSSVKSDAMFGLHQIAEKWA